MALWAITRTIDGFREVLRDHRMAPHRLGWRLPFAAGLHHFGAMVDERIYRNQGELGNEDNVD